MGPASSRTFQEQGTTLPCPEPGLKWPQAAQDLFSDTAMPKHFCKRFTNPKENRQRQVSIQFNREVYSRYWLVSLPSSRYWWHLTDTVFALGLPPADTSSSRLARCPFHPLNTVAIYITAGVYKASHIRITRVIHRKQGDLITTRKQVTSACRS